MRSVFVALSCVVLLCLVFAAFAQNSNQGAAPAAQPIAGFDMTQMDRSADPCVDFYQFVCGGWRAKNPIPADQSSWSRFNELLNKNQLVLKDILEKAAATPRNANEKKIGDFYASCMDEAAIDQKGLAPLEPALRRIDAIKSAAEVPAVVAFLHDNGIRAFFRFDDTTDYKDATQVIAEVNQAGLALPDRDYYIKDDAKNTEIRQQYQQHVERMFTLAGDSAERAKEEAAAVMQVETALAQAQMDRVAMRQPENRYHKMSRQELAALTPGFGWDRYLTDVNAPAFASVNVTAPEFIKAMDKLVVSSGVPAIKSYLRWHLLHGVAPQLPSKFGEEDFAMFEKVLRGTEQMEPRWKRCVRYTDRDLGEILGQPYVERTFGPAGKQRTLELVHRIEQAMQQDIKSLDWMTDATKQAALVKLHAVANKIGYPDKWRDYSALHIVRGDALGNLLRASSFEFHRHLNKIGKPVDKTEWGMTPPTVNAYYRSTENNINFPAGILQPPFFDKDGDDAVNFGGVGAVIGHELTHGFDDQGAKFDGQGNLRNWWTESDEKEFKQRTSCIADEYSQFEPVPGARVNGRLTLGENTADNGGLRLAYMALQLLMQGKTPQTLGGFTPEQRFFLGYGQIWCQNQRPEAARLQVQTNPHSPGRFRVTGVVQNMPEFQKAWNCKAGQPMVRQNACRAW